MAQVKIPAEFSSQIILLNDISAKNSEPGFDSPLTNWLIDNKIDLDADIAAGVAAQDKETLRAKQESASKTAFASRDAHFKPVFTFIRAAAQVLKKYYINQVSLLTDWGLPVTDNGRIAYPPSFEERNKIATDFFDKLATYGGKSNPLSAYISLNKIIISDLVDHNNDAGKDNITANKAEKATENATEQRDLLWKDPLDHIRKIAEYLKSINPTNPRALGDWGFVVDESVAAGKERKVKFKIGQTRTLENIAIGSILMNQGKGDAIVYKGKGLKGQATTLKVNDKMGMVKGYSVITIVNPSTLDTLTLSIFPPED